MILMYSYVLECCYMSSVLVFAFNKLHVISSMFYNYLSLYTCSSFYVLSYKMLVAGYSSPMDRSWWSASTPHGNGPGRRMNIRMNCPLQKNIGIAAKRDWFKVESLWHIGAYISYLVHVYGNHVDLVCVRMSCCRLWEVCSFSPAYHPSIWVVFQKVWLSQSAWKGMQILPQKSTDDLIRFVIVFSSL